MKEQALQATEPPAPGARGRLFGETWPLHGLRYALIVASIGLWLWHGQAQGRAVGVSLLVSAALLVELPLYGPGPGRGHVFWGAVQLAGVLGALALDPGIFLALALAAVIMGHGAVFPPHWAYASLAMACVGSVAAVVAAGVAAPELGTGVLVLHVLAFAVGRLTALRLEERRAHEATVARLEEAQARLSRLAATAKELATAEEHRRLSEELHDTLGHALVGTLLQVQLAGQLVKTDAEASAKRLELVEQSIRETLQKVRQALRRGRRGVESLPLHLALESLAAEFRALGGPEVSLTFRPDGESVSDVSPQVGEALFRTAQEALTNAVRHGKARRVEIEAQVSGPRLYLTIRDDGVGADSYVPGMGLLGMVSRIQSVGGTLRFQSQAGKGFQIHVGVKRR